MLLLTEAVDLHSTTISCTPCSPHQDIYSVAVWNGALEPKMNSSCSLWPSKCVWSLESNVALIWKLPFGNVNFKIKTFKMDFEMRMFQEDKINTMAWKHQTQNCNLNNKYNLLSCLRCYYLKKSSDFFSL